MRKHGGPETGPLPASDASENTAGHIYALIRRERQGNRPGEWAVALSRHGHSVNRGFSDNIYGSSAAALEQALAYRDAVIHALPPITSREKATRLRTDNTSGVAGVFRKIRESGPYWQAHVGTLDWQRAKSFSVSYYGEEGAKALAVEQRQAWLAEMPSTFHARADKAEAAALQQFPERLELVPDVMDRNVMSRKAIDNVLAGINAHFDRLRPVRLTVSVRLDRKGRLRGIVSLNKPSRVARADAATRSQSVADALEQIGPRLYSAVAELCGPAFADKFDLEYARTMLNLSLFDEAKGSSVTLHIPRHELEGSPAAISAPARRRSLNQVAGRVQIFELSN